MMHRGGLPKVVDRHLQSDRHKINPDAGPGFNLYQCR